MNTGTRIIVVGTSGSGKTTLAMQLSQELGLPQIELDALHWLPGWVERPDSEFLRLVADAVAEENWVADGNYPQVQNILWPRGTAVAWLNYSRRTVMTRVLRRTLLRSIFRTKLFSGNRESLRMSFFSRDSILLWAWTSYRSTRETYRQMRERGEFPHLKWVELRSPRQCTAWINHVCRSSKQPDWSSGI